MVNQYTFAVILHKRSDFNKWRTDVNFTKSGGSIINGNLVQRNIRYIPIVNEDALRGWHLDGVIDTWYGQQNPKHKDIMFMIDVNFIHQQQQKFKIK